MIRRTLSILVAVAIGFIAPTAFSSIASAQEGLLPMGVGVRDMEPPPSDIGIGFTGGAAVTGFTDSAAQSFTDPGVGWDVRVGIGTRFVLGGEVAYLGTAQGIDAVGMDDDIFLMSNGAEGVARLNILPGMVQPYVFAGIGWRNYRLVNGDFNNSSVENSDNIGHVPVGGGITLRILGLLVDARGTFRPAFDSDMMGEEVGLHTWSGELHAGFEF